MRVMYRMCQQVEHLNKLVGIHFKLYKSNLSVWRESFVRSLPGEINFIFVTTGKAICSEEQTCDSCVMKSLILSRHPPPSSEGGCEPLFLVSLMSSLYPHSRSSRPTWRLAWQQDRWECPRTPNSTWLNQKCAWGRRIRLDAQIICFLLDERHILGG